MFGVAIYLFIVGISNYVVSKSETERAERKHKAEKTADSANLVETINRALAGKNLQFNPQTGNVIKINSENVKGDIVVMNNSNPVVEGNQVNKTYISENLEEKLRRDLAYYASVNNIKDKDVYLSSCKTSKSDITVAKAREILKTIGYKVIAEQEAFIPKNWNPYNMHIATFNGKMSIIVGKWE